VVRGRAGAVPRRPARRPGTQARADRRVSGETRTGRLPGPRDREADLRAGRT
jgi:hypothetical protein